MPIIEAQATGRPVISSRRGAIPEIAGDSVCYVDPEDVEDISRGIRLLIENHDYREKLIFLGIQNIKRFEPDMIVKEYQKIYES